MPPSAGQLQLFGLDVPRHAAQARARLGLIGHQSMLYRDLTARENLELFARLYGVAAAARAGRGIADRSSASPIGPMTRSKPSAAECAQRLSIARALVHEPDLVLADEPFAGLDVPGALAVEQLLSELHADGKTIVDGQSRRYPKPAAGRTRHCS